MFKMAAKVRSFVEFSSVPTMRRVSEKTDEWCCAIYALVDPRDGRVRYVGKTERPLAIRLIEHTQDPSNADVGTWIADLRHRNLEPEIRLLSYARRQSWETAEKRWVAWFRRRGRLLNRHAGGRTDIGYGKFKGMWKGGKSGPCVTLDEMPADKREEMLRAYGQERVAPSPKPLPIEPRSRYWTTPPPAAVAARKARKEWSKQLSYAEEVKRENAYRASLEMAPTLTDPAQWR